MQCNSLSDKNQKLKRLKTMQESENERVHKNFK